MINGYKEYTDIIMEEQFRKDAMDYLKNSLGLQDYSIPDQLPRLYKYRGISDYSVNDLVEKRFTATSIGSFNDLFDGAMQVYGDEEERKQRAQTDWERLEELGRQCGFPGLLPHDSYVQTRESYYRRESRSKFRMAEYLGTYVFCLSERNDSVLMWAHYANENTGICIEYDFNSLAHYSLTRNCLFPVAYSSYPVNVLPLIGEDEKPDVMYPVDVATLCTALNKAKIWEYEREWRFVEIDTKVKAQRIYKESIKPKRVIFGNRFLKPLFYYEGDSDGTKRKCEEHYDRLLRLLDYMIQEHIEAAIAIPRVGNFELEIKNLSATSLKRFILDKFHYRNKSDKMRYYHVIADELFAWMEEGFPVDEFGNIIRSRRAIVRIEGCKD